MRPFAGRHVLLGVTGGIACYKAVTIARQLTQAGATVDVLLTRSAREFVGAITFEAVTGRPVVAGILDEGHALAHIRLAKAADLVLVAPATADFLARAAHGRADDQLTAILLATRAPVCIAPAMNDGMWSHPQVLRNATHLETVCGYHVIQPAIGPLAFGEGIGPGRVPEPEAIIAHAARLLDRDPALANRHIVVTAGPTREAVDPVRFLTNHSSGRMGVALAAAAWRRGATVTLIHGPLEVATPIGPALVPVTSTQDMLEAVRGALATADALIMAAAPADFTPAEVAAQKVKKGDAAPSIALRHTPDILLESIDRRRPGAVVMGFALETTSVEASAKSKLERKQLDFIVANDATDPQAGFGVDTNRVVLFGRDGAREALPLMAKTELADVLLDRVAGALGGR